MEYCDPTYIPIGIDPDGEIVYDMHYDMNIVLERPIEFISIQIRITL